MGLDTEMGQALGTVSVSFFCLSTLLLPSPLLPPSPFPSSPLSSLFLFSHLQNLELNFLFVPGAVD